MSLSQQDIYYYPVYSNLLGSAEIDITKIFAQHPSLASGKWAISIDFLHLMGDRKSVNSFFFCKETVARNNQPLLLAIQTYGCESRAGERNKLTRFIANRSPSFVSFEHELSTTLGNKITIDEKELIRADNDGIGPFFIIAKLRRITAK
jgi:hypothetical protein